MTKLALIGISVLILAVGYFIVRTNAGAHTEGEWLTDFEAAKKMSKDSGKPILADFTGSDWCGWCIKLKEEVFDKPEFKDWASENVILLEVDFPEPDGDTAKGMSEDLKKQNAGLADTYNIQGFPTILFLDGQGKVLAQSGYLPGGPEKWIEASEKMLARSKK